MPDLSHFIIVDGDSGTFFPANYAIILDPRSLTPEDGAILKEGTDDQRCDLAVRLGSLLEDLIDPNTL